MATIPAKVVAYGAKGFGLGLGAYNAINIGKQYSSGEISTTGMAIEQGSNFYSVFGPLWCMVGLRLGNRKRYFHNNRLAKLER